MFLFKHYQLLFALLLLLLWWRENVDATITFRGKGNRTKTYKTMDYFFRQEPYYKYEGLALMWKLTPDENCNLPQVNASDPDLKEVARLASSQPSFALLYKYWSPVSSSCKKVNTARKKNNWTTHR
jgi:hypothetical protein